MCSLLICNSCKPFIVVNSNITGIQGWDCLGQADISPGMWWSILVMQSHFERSNVIQKANISLWMQIHINTHALSKIFHFPIFPFSNDFANFMQKWILQLPLQLILQGAELFPSSLTQIEDSREKCFLKPLSYKVVGYTVSVTDKLSLLHS